MREHSRHRLERGDGIATLYMQLSPNRNQYFLGTEAMSKTMTISTKHTEERFVSLTDVIQLLTNSAKDLAMVSPHSRDNCVVALATDVLGSITLSLVRTSTPQTDLVSPEPKDIVSEETSQGKKAANVADQITKAQAAKTLTGEKYAALIGSSPNPDVTRAVLRIAQRGGAQIQGTHGDYARPQSVPIPREVQCEIAQTLKVLVRSVSPDGNRITAHIEDFGTHAAFWKTFVDPSIHIDALDLASKQGLLLAKLLEEVIEVEVSLSISMLQGPRRADICNASILKMPKVRDLALKVIKRLNEQLSLDLQFPD